MAGHFRGLRGVAPLQAHRRVERTSLSRDVGAPHADLPESREDLARPFPLRPLGPFQPEPLREPGFGQRLEKPRPFRQDRRPDGLLDLHQAPFPLPLGQFPGKRLQLFPESAPDRLSLVFFSPPLSYTRSKTSFLTPSRPQGIVDSISEPA